MPEELPRVSIIIPVFNQAEDLARCLAALERQTYPADRFEAIVVDNGSDRPIRPMAERFSFVRAICEPTPGSYAARNRGIEASRGELLAFTDADCLPAESWIERGVRAVQRLPRAGMVAGRIAITFHDPGKPTAVERFESIFGLPQDMFLAWGFGATANLFATRAAIEQVGLFDERLMSGGDMEWGQRLRALGLAQEYGPDACVFHPARRTVRQLWTKTVRVAGGLQQVADQRGTGTQGLPAHAVRQLIRMQDIRAHFADERLDTLNRRLTFAMVAWLVELVRVLERYRVHWGGRPSRV
jgi:glycosyltransferase involved in cell wall biosynthesis